MDKIHSVATKYNLSGPFLSCLTLLLFHNQHSNTILFTPRKNEVPMFPQLGIPTVSGSLQSIMSSSIMITAGLCLTNITSYSNQILGFTQNLSLAFFHKIFLFFLVLSIGTCCKSCLSFPSSHIRTLCCEPP